MKSQFLYISIHHQETVNHPAHGSTQRELQSMADSLFPTLQPDDRQDDNFSQEMSLEIIQELLEQNNYLSEKAVIYGGDEARTMMLAIILEAGGEYSLQSAPQRRHREVPGRSGAGKKGA
jgi:hypothetical protein